MIRYAILLKMSLIDCTVLVKHRGFVVVFNVRNKAFYTKAKVTVKGEGQSHEV